MLFSRSITKIWEEAAASHKEGGSWELGRTTPNAWRLRLHAKINAVYGLNMIILIPKRKENNQVCIFFPWGLYWYHSWWIRLRPFPIVCFSICVCRTKRRGIHNEQFSDSLTDKAVQWTSLIYTPWPPFPADLLRSHQAGLAIYKLVGTGPIKWWLYLH